MARPRTPVLSTARIADAAMELIDSEKPFGVNALARALGVQASSLYNHVDGRRAIIELVRGRLVETYLPDTAHEGRTWDRALEDVIRAERRMYTEHPHIVPLIATETVTDLAAITSYDRTAALLIRAGFPDEDVLVIIQLLDAFALGSGLDYAAPEEVWEPKSPTEHLGRLLALEPSGAKRSEQAFELGLDMLLSALRTRLERRRRVPGGPGQPASASTEETTTP
ncbi:TetR/AcrR family transcriptional regulator C-terminal domain-containing protein [Arthrobacter sp. NPDC090010]|uniref:TetR/AcrR family transcriptional regulator C-terminal domain-containing protein n=1 Tax=Arthrobacter sp. NPDC090010 TaxID=3363942 RepID=UPI00381B7B32